MNHIAFPNLGIELTLKKTAFSIGSFSVQWYGIIIAIGFALAVVYCLKRAPKFGLEPDNLIDMTLVATPVAIIGARLYYVVFNWQLYEDHPENIIKIWNGGIAIYGAIIFAAIAAAIYCKVKKVNLWNTFDLGVFGLLIGQLIGRWGNFVNAEAYGQTVEDWILGMSINGNLTVHPIFLYESLWNLLGFVLLHFISKKRRFYGQIFFSYIAWYGIGRGLIEGIRGDDALLFFDTGLRVSQVLGYLSALVAIGVIAYKLLFSDRGDVIELLSNEELAEQAAIAQAKKNLAEAGEVVEEIEESAETEENETVEETEETEENEPEEEKETTEEA
ncbi:MAG: prolipoprotein diacylglyceryl transferase [Clostridia bacterium]|nr:prolipoprotein diacylglyceryl transferase [Clostridia bacterium]